MNSDGGLPSLYPVNGLQPQASPGYPKSAPIIQRPRNPNPNEGYGGPRRTLSSSSDGGNNSGRGSRGPPSHYNQSQHQQGNYYPRSNKNGAPPPPLQQTSVPLFYGGRQSNHNSYQNPGWSNPDNNYHNQSSNRSRPSYPHRGRGRGTFSPSSQYRGRQSNPNFNSNSNQNSNDELNLESPQQPWITPEHLKMIQERNSMYEIYARDKSEESHRLFKIKRYEVNMAVNDAKYLYYQKNAHKPEAAQYAPYAKVRTQYQIKSEFHCDPCERKFASQELFDEHKAEHITCKLDGCTYTAHVKLVMKHIELQHSTNLFHRIKGFETPEEIEKWKGERKKNYPTPENIQRKKEERKERIARGENISGRNPGEEEVFRYKIIPEKEKRLQQKLNWVPRKGDPAYQSSGDEDFLPSSPKRKKRKAGDVKEDEDERFSRNKNVFNFSSTNESPLIVLWNFYTDIELCNGRVIGSTRKIWMPNGQPEEDVDNQIKNFEKDQEIEKNEQAFNITDDEEDAPSKEATGINNSNAFTISSGGPLSGDSNSFLNKIMKSSERDKDNKERLSTNSLMALAGLVNYCSSEDEDKEDNNKDLQKQDKEMESKEKESSFVNPDEIVVSDDDVKNEESPEELPTVKAWQGKEENSLNKLNKDEEEPEEGEAFSDGEDNEPPTELPVDKKVSKNCSSEDDEPPQEFPALVTKDVPQPEESSDEDDFNTKDAASVNAAKSYLLNGSKTIQAAIKARRIAESKKIVKKYTLLQRLLAPDIRKERNVILQACRYIIDNNFFDPVAKIQPPNNEDNQNQIISASVAESGQILAQEDTPL